MTNDQLTGVVFLAVFLLYYVIANVTDRKER